MFLYFGKLEKWLLVQHCCVGRMKNIQRQSFYSQQVPKVLFAEQVDFSGDGEQSKKSICHWLLADYNVFFLNFVLVHCFPRGEISFFHSRGLPEGLVDLCPTVLLPLSHQHTSNGERSHDSWKFIHMLSNHVTPGTAVQEEQFILQDIQ